MTSPAGPPPMTITFIADVVEPRCSERDGVPLSGIERGKGSCWRSWRATRREIGRGHRRETHHSKCHRGWSLKDCRSRLSNATLRHRPSISWRQDGANRPTLTRGSPQDHHFFPLESGGVFRRAWSAHIWRPNLSTFVACWNYLVKTKSSRVELPRQHCRSRLQHLSLVERGSESLSPVRILPYAC